MAAKPIDPKVRAQAIADLQAGDQPVIVAERYGIPAGTVRMWKNRFVTDSVTPNQEIVTPVRPGVEQRQQVIGDLVIDLLRSKLEASAAIARAAANPKWIAKREAHELVAIGEWLDRTALALGDRLAGRQPSTGEELGE